MSHSNYSGQVVQLCTLQASCSYQTSQGEVSLITAKWYSLANCSSWCLFIPCEHAPSEDGTPGPANRNRNSSSSTL